MTVSQAALKIFGEKTFATVKAVHRLIHAGTFPSARQLDPTISTSPYLIPEVEVDSFIAAEKKRGQPVKD